MCAFLSLCWAYTINTLIRTISQKIGAGLVVNKEKGLVVVGRNIIPFTMVQYFHPFSLTFIQPTHS